MRPDLSFERITPIAHPVAAGRAVNLVNDQLYRGEPERKKGYGKELLARVVDLEIVSDDPIPFYEACGYQLLCDPNGNRLFVKHI